MRPNLLFLVLTWFAIFMTDPLAASWNPEANPVTSLAGFKSPRSAIQGRDGDLYVVWDGSGLRVQRMLPAGDIAPGWPPEGFLVSEDSPASTHTAGLALDSEGGVIIVWEDHRTPVGQNFSDIYAKRIRSDGSIDPEWTPGGLPICLHNTQEFSPRILADGNGGFFVAWHDTRPLGGPPSDGSYMTRILENGTLDIRWPVDGLAIGPIDTYEAPVLALDGTGGVYVTRPLRQGPIRVSRFLPTGVTVPGWPFSGINVASIGIRPRTAPDGAGGLFITWMDGRSFATNRWDVRAARILSNGELAPGWIQSGLPVGIIPGDQYDPDVMSDGHGGIYLVWSSEACVSCGFRPGVATHLDGNGQPAPGWTMQGRPLSEGLASESRVCRPLSDGLGGLFVGSVTSGHIHAQHFTSAGEYAVHWPPSGRFINLPPLLPNSSGFFVRDFRGGFYSFWSTHASSVLVQRTTIDGRICGSENQPPSHSFQGSNSEVTVTVGEPFEILWTFTDPDGDRDDLLVEGLSPIPTFISLAPTLPASGTSVPLVLSGIASPVDAGHHEIVVRARDRCDASAQGTLDVFVNRPPVCFSAVGQLNASDSEGFRPVAISGVVDPDGDPVTVRVTAIHQDEDPLEPVSGRSCPDGRITDGQASVRDERSGSGDGRTYHLSFTATDDHGADCEGSVHVCIPHDRRQGSDCVDGGPVFDSIFCGNSRPGDIAGPAAGRSAIESGPSGELNVTLDLDSGGNATIELYDVSGRVVAEWEKNLPAGRNVFRLDPGRMAGGLYFLRIREAGAPVTVLRTVHVAR